MEYMHPSQPGNQSARQITAVDRKSLVLGFGNLSNSSSRIRRKGRCEGNVWGARLGGGVYIGVKRIGMTVRNHRKLP